VWRDAAVMAGKDLRIEVRSRVATNQVAPFALLVLVLFAFALDPDRGVLARAAAGLFWVAVLFCALLAIQRAFAVEAADGARDNLRLSGLDPAAIVNPARSAVDAIVKCFGPDHVAVALYHRMSTAEFDGLFGIKCGMDAAEDYPSAARPGDLADLIAA